MWQVTGSRLPASAALDGLYGFAQAADDSGKSGHSLRNGFRRKQVVTSFVSAPALSGFTPGNFQVLRQFLAEPTAKTFFHIRTNRIQAPDLLFDQFAPAKIFAQYFRVIPKILEKPASKLINAERFQSINRFWRCVPA
jgi:hypothetical protein